MPTDFDFELTIPPENQLKAIISLLLTNMAVSHTVLMQVSELASLVDTKIDKQAFFEKYEELMMKGFEEEKAHLLAKFGE